MTFAEAAERVRENGLAELRVTPSEAHELVNELLNSPDVTWMHPSEVASITAAGHVGSVRVDDRLVPLVLIGD